MQARLQSAASPGLATRGADARAQHSWACRCPPWPTGQSTRGVHQGACPATGAMAPGAGLAPGLLQEIYAGCAALLRGSRAGGASSSPSAAGSVCCHSASRQQRCIQAACQLSLTPGDDQVVTKWLPATRRQPGCSSRTSAPPPRSACAPTREGRAAVPSSQFHRACPVTRDLSSCRAQRRGQQRHTRLPRTAHLPSSHPAPRAPPMDAAPGNQRSAAPPSGQGAGSGSGSPPPPPPSAAQPGAAHSTGTPLQRLAAEDPAGVRKALQVKWHVPCHTCPLACALSWQRCASGWGAVLPTHGVRP